MILVSAGFVRKRAVKHRRAR